MNIPLFPLAAVLFPDGPLPLRIFEVRYLDMISRCLREDGEFGVVQIRTGTDVGEVETTNVGTLARIVDWYQGSDGILGITARGTRKFALHGMDRQPDGLYVGEIEVLAGEPQLELPDEFRPMLEQNLSQTMSDDKLGQQMQESMVVFPDKELASGDTWRREASIDVPNIGALAMINDYVYLGTVDHGGERCAKLHLRIRSPGKEKFDTVLQGTPATISMPPFETSSTVLVRASDGEPVSGGPVTVALTIHFEVAGQQLTVVNRTTSHSTRIAAAGTKQGETKPAAPEGEKPADAPR